VETLTGGRLLESITVGHLDTLQFCSGCFGLSTELVQPRLNPRKFFRAAVHTAFDSGPKPRSLIPDALDCTVDAGVKLTDKPCVFRLEVAADGREIGRLDALNLDGQRECRPQSVVAERGNNGAQGGWTSFDCRHGLVDPGHVAQDGGTASLSERGGQSVTATRL